MNAQPALSASLQPPHGLTLPGPVWGLDPSTLRLSVGIADCHGPEDTLLLWHTVSYSTAGGMDRRLAAALGVLLHELTDLRNRRGKPHAVYLEEPFGGSDHKGKIIKPHPHSFYFVAVVLCALGHLFSDVPVEMIAPTTWKAKAMGTGHGHAKKPEIMEWAHSVGYTGAVEDEADAIGIATAGAVLLTSA